ncbi:Ig-like domain-containing protein, partial [Brenneria goodwinii]|uniref:Ig-like domain-containing protein n=1 Tax=Brenneria goodwinii TaxID=1109412 RepID=UPI0036F00F54
MNNLSITAKESGVTSVVNASSGELYLSSPSIVKLQASRQDIASMTRSGNDLIVSLHSGEKVVLKNFYNAGEQGISELVLEESDGTLWWIKNPANQPQFESIFSIDEIMGGAESVESAAGGWPYGLVGLAGAAGVGGIIAIASDDGKNDDNRLAIRTPDAPTTRISEDGTTISGEAQPGHAIKVTLPDGSTLETVADTDGSWEIKLDEPLANGEAVTVTVTDAAGNVSAPVTATAPDLTSPVAPADLQVAEDGTSVSGSAEAGSTVTITDTAGNVLGSVTVGEDGSFNVPLSPALTNGEAVTVTVTDAAGNVSAPVTATAPDLSIPDTTAPDAPVAAISEDGLTVSGTAEPGSTVTVTLPDSTALTTTADAFGVYSTELSSALTNGEAVTVTATDAAGNVPAPVTVTAPDTSIPDTTAPDAPVAAISEDGLTVSGTAEAGSLVTVTLPDNSTQTTTAAANGTWSITLPEALTAGEQLTATATDGAGNVSAPVTVTAPDTSIPDTTAPDAPVAAISEDGLTVSGTAEPGSAVTVTLQNNATLTITADAFGVYSIALPTALTNGEAVTVTATDAAGNVSTPTTATAPDLTAPTAPADLLVAEDGTSVSGSAEAGSTVTITDPAGNVLGSVTVGDDGSFSVPLTPVQTNGEAVTVTVTDAAGNVSAPTTATAPDLTAPAAPADLLVAADGTSVSGSAETGSTVTITDADGNVLGSVTVGEDGSFSVPLSPALTNGEAVTISATDTAGNVSAPVTVTAPDTSIPDTTAPDAPVATISEDGLTVSGTAESGSTVTVTLPDSTALTTTADAFGVYSIALPVALTNGEAVTVTATDAAGNVSTPTTATAPDLTAPTAPADLQVAEDGASVSGTAEAGSSVTLTDADGNVLGSVTAGEDGSFSVPLSPALTNGEAVTINATDAAGNVSAPTMATAPDLTAPVAPADLQVAEDGASVSGRAETGSIVTITDADGNVLGSVTVGEDGSFSVPLTPVQTNGEAVTVTVTDAAGNVSAPTTATAPDLTSPVAPADLQVAEDGTFVSGSAEAGSTVTITDTAGNVLGSVTVGEDGSFNVPLSPALTNGEAVTISATDTAGNVSAPVTVTAPDTSIPDTTAPDAPVATISEDGLTVSGTAESGSTVTVTLPDSTTLTTTADAFGVYSIGLPVALTNGEAVTVTATDAAENVSAPTTATAPDLTAPSAPADLLVAEDGALVSGSAEAGSTVTITDADGNVLGSVTAGEDGSFNVPLSPALTNGEEISAVASDTAGNASAPVSVAAPDLTAPTAPADLQVAEDGASVSGTAEADSTVTITDADGNVLGSVTVGDDGNFSVPLTPALTNGEEISAVASDAAGNNSAPVSVAAPDSTAPDAPVAAISDDGTTVNGTAEAGSLVTVTLPDNSTQTTIAAANGTWNITLPEVLTAGEQLTATATDEAGNVSAPVTVTAPDTSIPDTTAPDAPVAAISEDGLTVSGTAEPGSAVTVTLPNNATLTITADEFGAYSIALPTALTNGEAVTVTATDAAGNVSTPTTATAPDLTAPTAPADLLVAADGTSVSGTAEPSSTVTITDADGNVLGSVTAGEDGSFNVPLSPALTNGEEISAIASDAAGNNSAPVSVAAPDLTAPSAPADLQVAEDGTSVSGSAEAGSTVTITDADGNVLGSETVGDDGSFSVPLSPALTNGEEINVVASDVAGNASAPVSVAAPDSTAPDAPVATISDDGTTVNGTAEVGSLVTVTLPDNSTQTTTAAANGTWSITLPEALTAGEQLTATATDGAGNVSAPVTVTAPDLTAPAAPADLLVAEDGASVSGSAEAGSTVTLTDADGNVLGSVTVGEDGNFSVPLSPALTNGEEISAVASDAAGNASAPVSVAAPDLTAPTAPADLLVAEDGTSVSGSAEAGSTVTITDADGNVLGSITVGEDGSFNVPLSPSLTNGEEVSAVASDVAGNASAPVSVAAPDLTAPLAPADLQVAEDGTSVSGTAEAGSTVTLTDADGNVLGSVTVGEDGSFSVPLTPVQTNGEAVTVTVTDAAGNVSAPTMATAPDLTAPTAPADLLVAADGTSVSGSAETGSTVTLTDADGNVLGSVTVGEDGSFSVPLSPALTNGEAVTISATDAAGNVSAPVTVTAPDTSIPDTTAPDAPVAAISEDGLTVSGTAEPGSMVTITLPDGTILTATTDAFGVYSTELSPALTNGEAVTVTATDAAGNVSAPTTATAPDLTAPTAPADLLIAADGTSVSGSAEAGSTVTLTDADGNVLGSVTAGEDGSFSVPLSPALTNGEEVSAVASDAAGNASTPVSVAAPDSTAPDAPVAAISDDGTTVSGTAEAGSLVTVTLPDNSTQTTTAAANGTWSITLPEALTAGEQLTATATDEAGNVSAPVTVTAPDTSIPDTSAPDAPVAVISEDGLTVSGTAEPGSTVTVTLPDSTALTATADAFGVYSIELSSALTNGEAVTVTATDAAGNVSAPTTATALDLTAPTAPADLLVAEDGASVSGTAEAGSIVTIIDADGNVLGSVTAGEDGSFNVPLTPALTNGEEISAVVSDAAGNASAPVSVAAPDLTAPTAPADLLVAEDGTSVSGSAEAGSIVTITDADGNVLGSITVGEDGSFNVP